MSSQDILFASLGVNLDVKKEMLLHEGWHCYSLNHENLSHEIPIILIEDGPKNITEVKKSVKNSDVCVVLFSKQNILFLKAFNESYTIVLSSDIEYERIALILRSCNIANASTELVMNTSIVKAIKIIPNSTGDFDNRGVFSTHYLQGRIFDAIRRNIDVDVEKIKNNIEKNTTDILELLGWNTSNLDGIYDNKISIIITEQDDFSIRERNVDVAPSYIAIASLKKSQYVILTNGKKWRLYTNKISASSTNYFEITLDSQRNSIIKYLVVIFGAASFEEKEGKSDIDTFFEDSKNYATDLEENLSARIMGHDGLFLDIIKGVLDHDMKKCFTADDLNDAKEISLKIMYRIWFLAYAESRNLLPVSDERYGKISLQSIHSHLDSYHADSDGDHGWADLLKLFEGIRDGDPEHNLPQYNGDLFKYNSSIDGIKIKNKFIVVALYGLLEKDGETIDYSSLSVRHLGNIFETLMDFSVRQTEKNLMLLEDSDGVREVKTEQESTYSYKKNDLYLASKGGIALRKMAGAFYTPDKIVEFLVEVGLKPIFDEREKLIGVDIKKYLQSKSDKDKLVCMDRLLDIQVLDPSMGSGHFLVETLNQITMWATDILKTYPKHPLLEEIESDRTTILAEQKKNGITIDKNLLTYDVLLKRKIMKRCIFGVDINPMVVELAKMSLWIDSFAIGVPLTYINHHIKAGDSTIGVRLDELKNPIDQSLDNWIEDPEKSSKFISLVGHNADITISQVQDSKNTYAEYVKRIRPHKMMLDTITALKMDKDIIPKKAQKNIQSYLRRISDASLGAKMDQDEELTIQNIYNKSNTYGFFQWDLEMMDAFTDSRRGFDLVIGNPPWDKVRPNAKEFFENLDLNYKKKSKEDQEKIRKKYDDEFKEYTKGFDDKREFYKNHGGLGENTDFELYRIIIERSLQVLAPGGMFSMIMPSAIVNSRGATALRKHILTKNIKSLHVFGNRKKIFPIHADYRFALLCFQNSKGSDKFPAGFYLYNLDELNNLKDKALVLSKKKIAELSPDMSMIYEVRNQEDYEIIQKLCAQHPRLKDMKTWQVDLGRELNIGDEKDKKLLIKEGGWPVFQSKNFHQHIHNFSTPQYRADVKKTLTRVKTIAKFHGQSKEIHDNPRLAYRTVSSSTNTRTMIACIIPQSGFTAMTTFMAIPRIGVFSISSDYHKLNAYLCGIFNSTTYDFIIRPKIDKHIETYHVYETPVPENFTSDIAKKISKLSAILALSETWHEDMADVFSISKKDVDDLQLINRIEIISEIDALVALQYGLTQSEYEGILQNFKFNKNSFSEEELFNNVKYTKLSDADRNKHMRRFYGEVYKRTMKYYNLNSNMKVLKQEPEEK